MPMATRLDKMMMYLEELFPIEVLDLLITWSYKINSQAKTMKHPLPQRIWPPNLEEW